MTIHTITVRVVSIVEVWLRVVLSTEAPITVESEMTVMRIVVRVVSAVIVAVSPVAIIKVVSSKCKWVSVVGLSLVVVMLAFECVMTEREWLSFVGLYLVSEVSTILVRTPAAVIRQVTTVVLSGMWLSICFFEHGSVIWAVWLSVFLWKWCRAN